MELFKLLGKIVIENSDANKALDQTSDKAQEAAVSVDKGSSGMMGAFKKVGAAVATYLTVDAIKDFGVACITAAADANAMESQFSQVFGNLEGKAGESLKSIADEAGISENRMKGSFTKIAAFAKTTGMDTEGALALSERAMVAVADSAAFYDRSLEETTESLQSFLKGNYENDAALGLSCTETTRNAAANKLYGKSFNDLSESQKQLTLLQMVEDANKASGALGQAARESDTWTNVTGNLKQAWTDFHAVLGKPVLKFATSAVGWLADKVGVLTAKFSTGTNPVQSFIDKIKDFGAWLKEVGTYAFNTFKPIISDVQAAFTMAKDALQPLIDKLSAYFTSGEAATDITNTVKGAIDLLAAAYEGAVGFVQSIVKGFQDAVTWGKEHETALALIATAIGTLTTAIVAYNVAQAIKNAGGIVELAQLGILQVQLWALTAAETAHTVATTIATAATSAFGAVLSFITSPITLVVLAIGALIAIVVLLVKNWDTVKEAAVKCWEWIKETWSKVAEWFNTNVIQPVAEFFSGLWDNIKTACSNAWEWIKGVFSQWGEWINTNVIQPVINFFTGLWEGLKNIWNQICNVVQVAVMFIGEILNAAFQIITLPFRFIWENCKEYVFAAWEWIKEKVSAAINAVKTKISTVMNAVKTVFTTVWNSIKSVTSTVWNAVKSVISKAWNAIKSAVTSAVNAVKSKVTAVWNSVKSVTSSIWNSVKSVISNVWNSIKSTVSNAVSNVKSKISSGLNSAKSTVTSVLNSIKSKFTSIFDKVKSTVKNAIDKIKGYFNFNWSLPKLKMPHFKISGKFSLNPPSVPKFSVEWYKKAMQNAMVLSNPTIFGYSAASGKYLGGGEAGNEVVAGESHLMNMIQKAVAAENEAVAYYLQKLIEMLATYFPQMLEAMDNPRPAVFDPNSAAAALAVPMNNALGKLSARKDRGR